MTTYGIYAGQKPGGSCPASNNKRDEVDCSALCEGRNCGTVSAAGCPDQVCGSGNCDPRAPCSEEGLCTCTPITTCESRKITCGTIVDNCGSTLVCDSDCSSPCAPLAAAEACGDRDCGSAPDGCGATVRCGSCLEEDVCTSSGACLPCPLQCHPMAACIASGDKFSCECPVGFSGDGISCTADAAPFVNDGHCSELSWESGDHFFLSQSVADDLPSECTVAHAKHSDSSSLDTAVFTAYVHDPTGGDAIWAVEVLRSSGSVGLSAGVFQFYWSAKDAHFYLRSPSRTYKLVADEWAAETFKVLSIIARADGSVVVGVDGEDLKAFRNPSGADAKSSFGLVASANSDAIFSSFLVATSAQVSLQAFGCWDAQELAQLLSSMLSIDVSLISVTVVCDPSGTSSDITIELHNDGSAIGKRSARAAAGATPINAAALISNLNSLLSSGAVMQGSIVAVTPFYAAAIPVVTVTSAGLSAGAIAGIVVGSVFGGILIIVVGGGIAYKLKGPSDQPDAPQQRPKSWRRSIAFWKAPKGGIDLEPAPGKTRVKSITARNAEGYA